MNQESSAIKDPGYQAHIKKAKKDEEKPLTKKSGEKVEVRELNDGQYIIDKGRVVDEENNFDRDYKGSIIVEEVGEPYFNEEKDDVMRVVRTADGNITGVRQKNIRRFKRKTFGFPASQKRYDEIFGGKDTSKK